MQSPSGYNSQELPIKSRVQSLPVSVIVASTAKGGIGKDGGIPWRLKDDMAYFKRITTTAPSGKTNAVIMGRKTWESIPAKFRPLPDRLNVVLSSTAAADSCEGATVARSLTEALESLAGRSETGEVFVIGGAAVYKEAVELPNCARIYLTRVGIDVDCDAFFPHSMTPCFK